MTKFRLDMQIEKWFTQNNADVAECFPSVLLDYYHVYCKHGQAFIFDRYLNPNSSCYEVVFFRDNEVNSPAYQETEKTWYGLFDEYCAEECC